MLYLLSVFPKCLKKTLKPTFKYWVNFTKDQRLKKIDSKIKKYVTSGQKPWSSGYIEYRERLISKVLNDRKILDIFLSNRALPAKYGIRMDERVVEYPWLFSRLKNRHAFLLDAGSAMNYPNILDLSVLNEREIIIFNLNVENRVRVNNVSYKYGDLRDTGFESNFFDEIVCISTLEHIGMDNTFIYSKDKAFKENKTDDYKLVIREFRRLLAPGGKLFLTVPYGKYENLGWQQQFDEEIVRVALKEFGGKNFEVTYFKYTDDGWHVSKAQECSECLYFDIHNRKDFDSDYAAAARAVACIEIVK